MLISGLKSKYMLEVTEK